MNKNAIKMYVKIICGDKIEKNEMGGACSVYVEGNSVY
jgi:hypothetical protein